MQNLWRLIKENKTIIYVFISIIIICLVVTIVYCTTNPFKNPDLENFEGKLKEADYVEAFCDGEIEHVLPDKTRIDCLTEEYAIEFDWAKKWAESIGQSLYYAEMTDKRPAVAIIVKSPKDNRYIERIKKVDKNITIFTIKSKDYKGE